MSKIKIRLVLVSLVCSVALGHGVYVSPKGTDGDPGTKTKPVYSLVRAFERMESLVGAGAYPEDGMTVWVAGGEYSFDRTLSLGPSMGGTAEAPLLVKAYGGKAVFNGGVGIDVASAHLVADEHTLDRLARIGRGKIYRIKIEHRKMKTLLQSGGTRLSQDGQMMNLARYPNVGYGHIEKILDAGAVYAKGRTLGGVPKYSMADPVGGVITLQDKDVSGWEKEFAEVQKAALVGYLSYDWYKESHRIASIEDGRIKLLEYSRYGVLNKQKIPRRLIVRNLLCELDSPGEFYFDDQASELFVWPFDDAMEGAKITVWSGVGFADLKGARHVRFENLVVEGVSQGKAVIQMDGCENIELAGCTIRNCSRPAVLVTGGKHCGLRSCDIYDVPHHLTLNGGQIRQLIPSGHYAVNNHFTQVQAADFYGKIQLKGVGQIFRNNLVHNFIGQVMTVSDNDHLIEYNELFNIGIEEGDGGTIYSGAQMWSHGNVYRQNFLHHLMCLPQAHPRGGIYPDDHDGGDTIRENVFYKAAHRALLLNGGCAHTVESNLFIEGHIGIYQTLAWAEKAYAIIGKYESGELKRGDKMDHIWRTEQVVGHKGWNNEPWISRYPTFAKVMNQEKMRFWPIECVVRGNLFSGNAQDMQVRTAWGANDIMEMRDCELIKTVDNRQISMAVFRDPAVLDFGFKHQADRERLPDIQFEKIGLFADHYRTSVPEKKTYRRAIRDKFHERKCYDAEARYDATTINESIYFNTGKLLMQH